MLGKNSSLSAGQLRIVMAQLNPLVGDIPGNTQLIIKSARLAIEEYSADIVVFSELTLTAYPPEDLLLRPSLDQRIETALEMIKAEKLPVYIVFGHPGRMGGKLYNILSVIYQGEILCTYSKQCLPNYQVFDEKRYFEPGSKAGLLVINNLPIAFTICEDLWEAGPMLQAAEAGAKLMININGSPFHADKLVERQAIIKTRALEGRMPVIYVNQVGGQDELVFDGTSMAVDHEGAVKVLAPPFEEALRLVKLNFSLGQSGHNDTVEIVSGELAQQGSRVEEIYKALVLGVRDYVGKNGFAGVVLGLSGGIDSALTLAIAVDALGSDKVHAVMMPFKYTSQMSIEDAEQEALKLKVEYRVIPIAAMYESFMEGLRDEFTGMQMDLTEQNIQARCRGVILMAISNKKGLMVLTTGNKSEMAVGYSTLYGDMAGGFDVLKDVPKMLVYELARYRNESYGTTPEEVIPQRVIDRPPSAELAPDQLDEDNLPPYEELDRILELYIEQDMSANAIVHQGFAEEVVARVLCLVDLNEYKRRQAPIGVRISKRGFGRDRRYPVTSGWKPGE
ncbi:NAD+ synthase [Gammaproteobacteria bacterium]|nr:NAD+ synthase [Gammaproteobacteria bacterium]